MAASTVSVTSLVLFVAFLVINLFASYALFVAFLVINLFASYANAQAPAPASTFYCTAVDRGIAYVLMFLALALTYLIHPLDAVPHNLF